MLFKHSSWFLLSNIDLPSLTPCIMSCLFFPSSVNILTYVVKLLFPSLPLTLPFHMFLNQKRRFTLTTISDVWMLAILPTDHEQ